MRLPLDFRPWLSLAIGLSLMAAGFPSRAQNAEEPEAAASDPASVEAELELERFFETEVRPLLAENCVKCHGEDRQKGGLRLDSREGLMSGGFLGPAVVPGEPEESPLIWAVRREGPEMPPTGDPLDDQAIAQLERWVELGAHWPSGADRAAIRGEGPQFTEDDRSYWAFQPVETVEPPAIDGDDWSRNPIDRFVLRKLRQAGLSPAPEADRRTFIRRVTFDLTGLPPTPEAVETYVNDPAGDAHERLVDRLLESDRYGEHWGRHWLDLVRYAESNGYRADEFRPNAWRYRDYVIQALNDDLPYDQFLREQLAGDEIDPDDPTSKVATGYLRLWTYESNQRDVETQWDAILNDVTDVTADVFLGLGMACARCHDHKYDPILQEDYFRLRAVFEPLRPRDDLSIEPTGPGTGVAERRAAWEALTADIRAEIAALEGPIRERAAQTAIEKFQPGMRAILNRPKEELAPRERQLHELAFRQVLLEWEKAIPKQLKGEKQERWEALQERLEAFEAIRPPVSGTVDTVTDLGANAPPTVIPGSSGEPIEPGPLTLLDPEPWEVEPPSDWAPTTGRRSKLADWLTDPDNPLTSRVIVNRLWARHFGRGIVATTSDFGRLGEPPTHPELLDWLAARLIDEGWSLKAIHRLILTSSTYRQASTRPDETAVREIDPQNRWLWHVPIRRLEAESIRDAVLAVSGELDPTAGGPSVETSAPRRSIYTKFKRNTKDPLLDVFDVADGYGSVSARNVTTTPTQSLLMINGDWALERASAFADRLFEEDPNRTEVERIDRAFRLAFGRPAEPVENDGARAFLADQSALIRAETNDGEAAILREAWVDFCHILLNANEFLYVD